ncbi:MAG: translin family protein [Methanomassiliicoccales archaeon]|jgi:translin
MKNLDEIADNLIARLDEKDTVREIAIKSSRAIIRLSGSVVHGVHKKADVAGTMEEAKDEANRLRSLLSDHPDIWHSGIVEDAMQELSEAAIMLSIVADEDLPTPEEIGVTPSSYLMGLADTIGELRRFSLDALKEGRMEDALRYLDMMEEMYRVLMRFDYPDALVAVRRKQDIARSLLEKTRGEVVVGVSTKALGDKIGKLYDKL